MAKKDKNQDQVEQVEAGEAAETVTNDTVLKWGDFTLDLGTVPKSTVVALAQRGFTHVMGNEVSSFMSGMKKAVNEDGSAKYTEADIEAAGAAKRAEKVQAMIEGKLGVRAPGVARVTGIDKHIRDIAVEELRAIAAAKKVSLPRKAEELQPLIDKHLAKHGDRVRAKAQAKMDELAALGLAEAD